MQKVALPVLNFMLEIFKIWDFDTREYIAFINKRLNQKDGETFIKNLLNL